MTSVILKQPMNTLSEIFVGNGVFKKLEYLSCIRNLCVITQIYTTVVCWEQSVVNGSFKHKTAYTYLLLVSINQTEEINTLMESVNKSK